MPEIDQFLKQPPETQRRQLKRLVFETVPEGEVKETAFAIGVEAYTLYKMRDGNVDKYSLIRPELIKIIHLRQDFRLLDFLEGLFGRAAFAIPKPSEHHTDINRATTKALKSFSGYMEEVSDLVDRLDDGENMFDQDWDRELRDIEIACRAHQAKVETLLHTVRMARGVVKIVKLGTAQDGFQVAKAGTVAGR